MDISSYSLNCLCWIEYLFISPVHESLFTIKQSSIFWKCCRYFDLHSVRKCNKLKIGNQEPPSLKNEYGLILKTPIVLWLPRATFNSYHAFVTWAQQRHSVREQRAWDPKGWSMNSSRYCKTNPSHCKALTLQHRRDDRAFSWRLFNSRVRIFSNEETTPLACFLQFNDLWGFYMAQ